MQSSTKIIYPVNASFPFLCKADFGTKDLPRAGANSHFQSARNNTGHSYHDFQPLRCIPAAGSDCGDIYVLDSLSNSKDHHSQYQSPNHTKTPLYSIHNTHPNKNLVKNLALGESLPLGHGSVKGPHFVPIPRLSPRDRIGQACNKCRSRKAKCTGEKPSCRKCTDRGLGCVYSESRVRAPSKYKQFLHQQTTLKAEEQAALQVYVPALPLPPHLLSLDAQLRTQQSQQSVPLSAQVLHPPAALSENILQQQQSERQHRYANLGHLGVPVYITSPANSSASVSKETQPQRAAPKPYQSFAPPGNPVHPVPQHYSLPVLPPALGHCKSSALPGNPVHPLPYLASASNIFSPAPADMRYQSFALLSDLVHPVLEPVSKVILFPAQAEILHQNQSAQALPPNMFSLAQSQSAAVPPLSSTYDEDGDVVMSVPYEHDWSAMSETLETGMDKPSQIEGFTITNPKTSSIVNLPLRDDDDEEEEEEEEEDWLLAALLESGEPEPRYDPTGFFPSHTSSSPDSEAYLEAMAKASAFYRSTPPFASSSSSGSLPATPPSQTLMSTTTSNMPELSDEEIMALLSSAFGNQTSVEPATSPSAVFNFDYTSEDEVPWYPSLSKTINFFE